MYNQSQVTGSPYYVLSIKKYIVNNEKQIQIIGKFIVNKELWEIHTPY